MIALPATTYSLNDLDLPFASRNENINTLTFSVLRPKSDLKTRHLPKKFSTTRTVNCVLYYFFTSITSVETGCTFYKPPSEECTQRSGNFESLVDVLLYPSRSPPRSRNNQQSTPCSLRRHNTSRSPCLQAFNLGSSMGQRAVNKTSMKAVAPCHAERTATLAAT